MCSEGKETLSKQEMNIYLSRYFRFFICLPFLKISFFFFSSYEEKISDLAEKKIRLGEGERKTGLTAFIQILAKHLTKYFPGSW